MYQNLLKENRLLTTAAITLFLFLAAGWILYALFGHQLTKAMYEDTSIGFLNRIIESQDVHPLEHYLKEGNWLFFGLSTIFCAGVILFFLALSGKDKAVFYGLLILYISYWSISIIRAGFIIDGIRYSILAEDTMVSMRYAKNLAAGYGLVWNPQQAPVEGYTNFLWVMYMAFWHLFPIHISKTSLPIHITGLLLVVISLFLVRKVVGNVAGRNKCVTIGAVLLTASYLPMSLWAMRGVETSALGVIILAAIWRILKCLEEGKFDVLLYIILGIGMLIRVDFAYLFVGMTGFVIFAVKEVRRKNIAASLSVFLLIAAAQTLFRWFYYKDFLPNTYYLKIAGVPLLLRAQRGLWSAWEFIKSMSLPIFALPFLCLFLQIKNRKIWLLIYIFLLQLGYSVYVGGDVWEVGNRFFCIAMPALFILMSLMVIYLIEKIKIFKSPALKKSCISIILLFIIFQIHGGFRKDYAENPIHIFSFLRLQGDTDKEIVSLGLKLEEITKPEATIAVTEAGIIPYYIQRSYIDLLGKNDAYIAHQKARVKTYRDFFPGHNKHDYGYSVGKLKPDVIINLWPKTQEEYDTIYSRYVEKDYVTITIGRRKIFCRKDSPRIRWEKIGDISLD